MKVLKCDLNKSILNVGFVGAVLLTTLLCFTSRAYTDPNTAKIYTVFESVFKLDRQLYSENYSFCSYMIFAKGMSGYMAMFLPIIAAFPFMISFCTERNSGLMRFNLIRTGAMKYYISKFFSAFLCGGSSVFLGFIIYGIIVRIIFPPLSGYQLSAEDMSFVLMNNKSELIGVLRYMLSSFLYGGISTMPGFFISSFCKNPYLVTCVPFMVTYMWQITIQKLIANSMINENYDAANILDDFYPNSIMNLSYYTTLNEIKYILLFNAAIIVFSVTGFVIIMNMRSDRGA